MSDTDGSDPEEPTIEALQEKLEATEKSRRGSQGRLDSATARANKAETELANLQAANAEIEKARMLDLSDEDAGKAVKVELRREPTETELRARVEQELTDKLLADIRIAEDFKGMSKEKYAEFVGTIKSPADVALRVAEHSVKIALEKEGLTVKVAERSAVNEDRKDSEEIPDVVGQGSGTKQTKLTLKRMKNMTAQELMSYPRKERLAVLGQ